MIKSVSRLVITSNHVSNSIIRFKSTSIIQKTTAIKGAQTSIPALKVRPAKQLRKKPSIGKDSWSVVGYSTADSYNLLGLRDKLEDQVIRLIIASIMQV